MLCYICRDEYSKKYIKICICNDSILCDDCFNIINEDKSKIKKNCAICKKKLNLNINKTYLYYKELFRYISYLFLIYLTLVLIPIIIFMKNLGFVYNLEKDDINSINNIFFFIINLLVPVIHEINIINYYNIFYIRNNERKCFRIRYYMIYIILNNCLGSIFLLISKKALIEYTYINFIINYLLPMLLFSIIKINNNIKNKIIKLYDKYCNLSLKCLEIIENEDISYL